MTKQSKDRVDELWDIYGPFIKPLVRFSGRIIVACVAGLVSATQFYASISEEWEKRGIADLRHDSIALLNTKSIDTLKSKEPKYVMREELKPSAFKSDNLRIAPSVSR